MMLQDIDADKLTVIAVSSMGKAENMSAHGLFAWPEVWKHADESTLDVRVVSCLSHGKWSLEIYSRNT